jgi:SM-20-related protein
MHSVDFFQRRGLFCVPEFVDPPTRAALVNLGKKSRAVPARVFNGNRGGTVDAQVRNTLELPLDDRGSRELTARLDALQSPLAEHFGTALSGHEGPSLLMYPAGGFYEPHTDGARGEALPLSHRRVSIVLFLNQMRDDPGPDEYSGGALTLYGLVDDPAWRRFGFALDAPAGLLLAFRSDIVHEVTPVTAGNRFTLVDWFTA